MAPAFDLNGAASEFSIRLIREKVTALSDECNQELDGDLNQLRALLNHVDQKRTKFQENKSNLLEGLRATLSSLQVDAAIVNTTLSDIAATSSPPLLSLIPTVSTLHLESRPLTPAASPPESGLAETTKSPHPDSAGSDTASDHDNGSKATSGDDLKSDTLSGTQAADKRKDPEAGNVKTSPGSQALVVHREKRPHESPEEPEHELKKAKTSSVHEEPAHTANTEIHRRDGFYVIRCLEPDCSLRISDTAPFKYKRAFNHFNSKHLKQPQSEEYIFEEYAYQVEDATEEAVAARSNGIGIPECTPKDKLPDTRSTPPRPGSPRRVSKTVTFDLERSPSLGYHNWDSDNGSGPSDIAEGDLEGNSSEPGKTRHNLRRLPRLSYNQMVQGRDPTPTDPQDQSEEDKAESSSVKRAGTPSVPNANIRGSRSAKKLLRLVDKPRRPSDQPHK
ncbi:hypothetical protein PG993_004660 [Apiospora rasikravindrae]|uniref:Shugoshin C-terminal domain-containing protein n=1 Tax=Apiospora rasikravindrae TaxID=990691 RepID=A0ABR1TDE7_9PEZI